MQRLYLKRKEAFIVLALMVFFTGWHLFYIWNEYYKGLAVLPLVLQGMRDLAQYFWIQMIHKF